MFNRYHAIVAAAATLAAAPAMAQMAGTYNGMNNEGAAVQIVVSAASGGGFEITGLSDGGTVYCPGGKTYGYGVGFGGNLAAIVNGKATYKALFSNVAINSTFTFSGTSVAGKMTFTVPILLTAKKGAACSTKPQTYTATFAAAAARALPPGAYAQPLAK